MKVSIKQISLLILVVIGILVLSFALYYSKEGKEVKIPRGASVYQGPQAAIYPNSALTQAEGQTIEDGFFYTAKWESEDEIPTISAWFIENMPDSGWEVYITPADVNSTDIQLIVFEDIKKDRLNVSLIKNANITEIIFEFIKPVSEDES